MKLSAEKSYEYILATALACFCFVPGSISLFVILLLVFTVVQIIRKKMKFVFSPVFLTFVLLYLAYAFGILFTNHLGDAFGYLEKKLVLVLFPLLFSFRFEHKLDLRPITLGLVAGTVVLTILSVINGIKIYHLTHDFNNSFGSTSYSYIHHPTYYAAMATIALLMVREGVRNQWKYFNNWTLGIYFLLTCANLLFCFSFASLLFFSLVIIIVLLNYFYRKLSRTWFFAGLVFLPLIPVSAYYGNIHIRIEVNRALNDLKTYIHNPNSVFEKVRTNPSGNQTRLLMWTISVQEFLDHPMGSGTANFDDKLGKRLRDKGLDDYAELKYNPHNQFLQVAVEIGIFGLLIFLLIIFSFFRMARKYRSGLLFWVTFNLLFNCFFESMLQRQSGIVFYVFLMCLFAAHLENRKSFPKVEPDEQLFNQ
ncbi:O-antigen ligase family protein [Fluviicola sp.]|uniref:O-antigen ligase family protein n=1 Tax=Fluviicola sp. TaxID=1917219 RepID=UPI00282DC61B|nr:O-antigen ligase family protein [Fluviicola sp.]MDR0801621.1 O-antigen ligase family protein [Fluviicola sp.]